MYSVDDPDLAPYGSGPNPPSCPKVGETFYAKAIEAFVDGIRRSFRPEPNEKGTIKGQQMTLTQDCTLDHREGGVITGRHTWLPAGAVVEYVAYHAYSDDEWKRIK